MSTDYKLFIGCEAEAEYNDNTYDVRGGLEPKYAFTSREEADKWCSEAMLHDIESRVYWLDQLEDDDYLDKRIRWYYTHRHPNPEKLNVDYYNWREREEICELEEQDGNKAEFPHDALVKWCKDNDKPITDYYMGMYCVREVTFI